MRSPMTSPRSPRSPSSLAALVAISFVIAALAMAGCSMGAQDSAPQCTVVVHYNPDAPRPSATVPVRAIATVHDYDGIARYQWRVLRGEIEVPFSPADPDDSMIEFFAPDAGVYRVELNVSSGTSCPMYTGDVNVLPEGARPSQYRLRITPPPGFAGSGPQEQLVELFSGVEYAAPSRALLVGEPSQRLVRSGSTPVAAYLRFTPSDGDGLLTEVSSGANGLLSPPLTTHRYDVVVVPTGERPPFRLRRWPEGATGPGFDGPAGSVVNGEVRDPDNAPVAGARVSVKVDGLPATVAVSAADGTFSLWVSAGDGMEVSVVPPSGRGLPRLVGAAPRAGQLAIRFNQSLARRDVAGLQLRRQGAAAASARVTFVGSINFAGSLNSSTVMRGEVRIAAQAGADGRLLSTSVPQAELSAVVEPAAGELAVLPINTGAPPAALDAPAMRAVTGFVRDAGGAGAQGAVVELIPEEALAAAGEPPRSVVAGAGGAFSLPSAPGGSYRAVFSDPQQRGTSRVLSVLSGSALGGVALGRGNRITSKLTSLSASPVRATTVELFCTACPDGPPLSTAVTDDSGAYSLLVPDVTP